jgi:dnd system-associated protein 4
MSQSDNGGTSPHGGTGTQRRLNRPKDKQEFLDELIQNGPFREYRDALVFAAAVGWFEKKRQQLGVKGESIRWETATNRRGTEALANMIAAVESGDPEILADARFDERLTIFEEYANGGLEIIRNLLAAEPRPAVDVILELIQKVSRSDDARPTVDLAGAADELDW